MDAMTRNEMTEKIVVLLQRKKDVTVLKKTAVKSYEDQIKDVEDEINDILKKLNDGMPRPEVSSGSGQISLK